MIPYAEVIGDPVAHSRSPAIHGYWLNALGLTGDYRAARIGPDTLAGYLATRRADLDWRGCNVTAPLKRAILPHLDLLSAEAEAIGAVNCVMPAADGLIGFNTDVDGIREALTSTDGPVREAAMIGSGGAARAAAWHLLDKGCQTLHLLVRSPARTPDFLPAPPDCEIIVHDLEAPEPALARADLLVNASPRGMTGQDELPASLLQAVATRQRPLIVFDMVYAPPETALLRVARDAGHPTVAGLAMLIGQARNAFWLFFGNAVPRARDEDLCRALRGP